MVSAMAKAIESDKSSSFGKNEKIHTFDHKIRCAVCSSHLVSGCTGVTAGILHLDISDFQSDVVLFLTHLDAVLRQQDYLIVLEPRDLGRGET